LRSNGKRICRSLRESYPQLPIILIVDPGQTLNKDKCANTVLVLPFTPRKLINWILQYEPGTGDNALRAGHICLDVERNRVYCLGKEARLTPRLSRLLDIFMQHPGEVLKREYLFREIWNTEYLEDTRTLDVHISWLRQAIEADPRQPRFLKTIRKVGYRLDEEGK
ncbi:MAG: winged helix-turn-helix domain-containing protein, partial [Omnitrophica WOR_2 bacterium]